MTVSEQEREAELPERWSAKGKTNVVLRLLRGEGVEAESREVQVPAHELAAWWRQMIGEFVERYNQAWLLERHSHRTPADVRAGLTRQAA